MARIHNIYEMKKKKKDINCVYSIICNEYRQQVYIATTKTTSISEGK